MKAKLAVIVLAIYTVILGALAMMGAPVIAYLFYVALFIQVLIHTFWLCPKCVNMACPVNPHSPDYVFGPGDGKPRIDAKAMNTALPISLLGLTFLFGLSGVWFFNELASYVMFILGIILLYMYSRVACQSCVNKCVLSGR
jgi:hypothetical protein